MIRLIASDLDATMVPEGTFDLNPEYFDVIRQLKQRNAQWIHEKIPDKNYFGGFKYSATCKCSVCGFVAGHEMPECPRCKTRIMR